MKRINIMKAHPIGDQVVEGVEIVIEGMFICSSGLAVDRNKELHQSEAQKIEEALIETLPGGTYDALLGLMHARKASQFIVSHKG